MIIQIVVMRLLSLVALKKLLTQILNLLQVFVMPYVVRKLRAIQEVDH